MRDFKGMKRQRGRNRGGGGGNTGGGGGKPQHNANRAFDSNGPDGVKIRGAAQHVYEKYQQLARDATTSGDRVLGENYLQHAEHYFRVLRAMQPQRPLAEIIGRDQFVSGYDIDFEDETGNAEAAAEAEAAEAAEAAAGEGEQPRFENRGPNNNGNNNNNGGGDQRQDRYEGRGQRDDRPYNRDDRPRDDRPRDDRQQRDDYRPRDDNRQGGQGGDNRQGGQGGGQGGDYRQRDDRPRDDRPRDDRPRDDRPQRDRNFRDDRPRYNRDDRPQRDRQDRAEPLAVIEPEATPLVVPREAPVVREAPVREVREPRPARVLRADNGEISHAPAFLQARPAAEEAPAEAAKPRRRRAAPTAANSDEG